MVISASHIGRERRRASLAESRRWADEHGERRNGSGLRSLLVLLPRGALYTIILFLSTSIGWLMKGWVDDVNKHMQSVPEGMGRLSAVESLASSTAATLTETRGELAEMRGDQLEFYQWMARLEGDKPRADDLDKKLQVLKRGVR